jgi:hypothetical protein
MGMGAGPPARLGPPPAVRRVDPGGPPGGRRQPQQRGSYRDRSSRRTAG